ncbi:unnamed protein product [Rotaria sp. Silwood2]|nr:unnamed protein product [Rotaria sp. Silwood2]CAF3197086.1 unnamed protein product [Rotaria sp. Silwood2]CAF3911806.1 unnamed protein product [Rotaria sp. Silwood2]CAF4170072.1 unnamed protein product [Rotaria sp. Silwood2]CAF4868912.1 unnamed protein product [Rotaria sp. Silwood2]
MNNIKIVVYFVCILVFLAEHCHAIKGKKSQQAVKKGGCLSLGAVCNSHTDCCGHDDPESGHCILCTGILPGLFGVGSRTCGCSKYSVAGTRDTGTLTNVCDGKDRSGSRVCRTRVAPPGHIYYRGDDYYYGRGKKVWYVVAIYAMSILTCHTPFF